MKIEGVIICRNYGDFLLYTLPYTKEFLDRFVVVTSPDDSETLKVCEYHKVQCHVTEAFDVGGPLNKGAAINEGLSLLDFSDWLLILDADIIVPDHVRPFLMRQNLNPECIYGVDRKNCDGIGSLHTPERLPTMKRIEIFGAFPPAGYFQLWHSSAIPHGPWYEDHYGYADRTDISFAKRFPLREYLPTWVIHLDKGGHDGGSNWRGRKSERFSPEDGVRLDLGQR